MVLTEECGVGSLACGDLSHKILARIRIDESYAH
jgi:hypothetical protein